MEPTTEPRFQDDRDALLRAACSILESGRPIEKLGPPDKQISPMARVAIGASDLLRALDWTWGNRRKPGDAPVGDAATSAGGSDVPF